MDENRNIGSQPSKNKAIAALVLSAIVFISCTLCVAALSAASY